MNIITTLQNTFDDFLQTTFIAEKKVINACKLTLNIDESKQSFGDLNSNAAMILAKLLKKAPREIAEQITNEFTHPVIEKIEIAGPGFLNFFLTLDAFQKLAQKLFDQQETFFKPDSLKKKYNISLEFVSANPTGPLHFGHGRGGIIGDVLGNILRFLGHDVTKEFYINDAGRQMQKLGESFKIRCMQKVGIKIELPEDSYRGEYLIELAKDCYAEFGDELVKKPNDFFAEYAKNELLSDIRQTLEDYGIEYDVWFSEKTLHESNAVKKVIEYLRKKDLLYKQDGAEWFRTSLFGDDKDRVVRKKSGEFTYIASDIAYVKNKINRGHNKLILVLGHDHHSYVVRLQASQQGLDLRQYPLDVILYQLVKITQQGRLVRMSKRAGTIITLQDVINTIDKDVARFFYLNRKADAQLEFNLDLALKKTEENPVYYVQYAYVRTKSILAKAEKETALQNITQADAKNLGSEETFLLKKIIALKELLEDIGQNYQTHLLTYYVLELAQTFHKYYSKHRVIDLQNVEKSRARLLMVIVLRKTIATVLQLLGITQPEKM